MQYRYDKEKNPVSMLAFGCMRFTKENGKINLIVPEAVGKCRILPIPEAELRDWMQAGGVL